MAKSKNLRLNKLKELEAKSRGEVTSSTTSNEAESVEKKQQLRTLAKKGANLESNILGKDSSQAQNNTITEGKKVKKIEFKNLTEFFGQDINTNTKTFTIALPSEQYEKIKLIKDVYKVSIINAISIIIDNFWDQSSKDIKSDFNKTKKGLFS